MCPEIEVFRDLIHGTLPQDVEADVTEHLGACPGCQYRFDQMAGPDGFVDRIPKMLGDSEEMTVLDTALDRLEAETSRGLPRYPGNEAQPEYQAEGFFPVDDAGEFSPYGDVERWFGPSDDPDALGTLAGYQVVEFVGRGGMGVVFRGRDRALDRDVAVKVLAPSLAANTTARERFFREARSAAAINHSNVATVHSVEESAQLPCMVMEYVDGQSLRQRLDDAGALPLKELIRIGYQVASGLDAAHAKGIVHRDIKPGNILLEASSRRVRLTDFGLARVATDDTLTQTGLLVGTPGYIAPEVANGDEADHRSDLFSFGCLLYVMATGEAPFRSDSTMQSLRRVVEEDATRVRELNQALPVWLDELIASLLEKSPDDRPQSASDVKRLFKRKYRELKNSRSDELNDSDPAAFDGFRQSGPAVIEVDTLADSQERTELLPVSEPRRLLPIAYAGAGAALLAIALGIGTWLGSDEQTDEQAMASVEAASHSAPESIELNPAEPEQGVREEGELDSVVMRDDPEPELPGPIVPFEQEDNEPPEREGRGERPIDDPEAAPRVDQAPFLVLDDGEPVESFESLHDAIEEADDGHSILVLDDGPFELGGLPIHQDELEIAAAPGTRPVLQLDFGGDDLSGELFLVYGSARFMGLEFRCAPPRGFDEDEEEDLCLVRCYGSVQAMNCRFVHQLSGQCLAVTNDERVELVNCELHAPGGHIVSWGIDEYGELLIQNCIMTAETAFFFDGDAREFQLGLNETTIIGGSTLWLNLEQIRLEEDEPGLAVNAERTVFDVDDAHLVLEQEELFELTNWEGEHNVYRRPFAAIPGDEHLEIPDNVPLTVEGWTALDNVRERRSVMLSVEYEQGRDVLLGSAFVPASNTAARFGIQAERVFEIRLDGIPGANVEEIGPGPAFEHWLSEHQDDEDWPNSGRW